VNPKVEQVFSWIDTHTNFEKTPAPQQEYRLDRMAALLAKLGNPQHSFRSIHVAGSKGKGSTCAYAAAIIATEGARCGLYASPHVLDWRERIREQSGFFEDKVYIYCGDQLRNTVSALPSEPQWGFGIPTTFELLTCLAFLCFRDQSLPWAVVEVGLGGRLDATNLLRPELCLITHLELEHTDVLGPTIAHIASEKAGIMKAGVPCLSQDQVPEAAAILKEHALSVGSPFAFLSERARIFDGEAPGTFTIELQSKQQSVSVLVRLAADSQRQRENAALAVAGLCSIGQYFDAPRFSKALSTPLPPGRQTKLFRGSQKILLDGAHTLDSVASVLEVWGTVSDDHDTVLLFAAASGKRIEAMASILTPLFNTIVVCGTGSVRPSDPEATSLAFGKASVAGQAIITVPDPKKAVVQAIEQAFIPGKSGFRLLICGSFFLAAAVLPVLAELGFKPESEHLSCP